MDNQTAQSEFAAKFKTQELYLARAGAWDIALRPAQLTLGAMVVSVRSGAFQFANLSEDEHRDMGAAFAVAERIAKAAFGPVRINVLCLMMQDPIVHFHILPRYDGAQDRFGETWTDADWPGPPVIAPCDTSSDVLRDIRDAMLAVM